MHTGEVKDVICKFDNLTQTHTYRQHNHTHSHVHCYCPSASLDGVSELTAPSAKYTPANNLRTVAVGVGAVNKMKQEQTLDRNKANVSWLLNEK